MKSTDYGTCSDEQLVQEFLKGDTQSFGVLYTRYYIKVYSKCYSFTKNRDDAFDMAQEILLKTVINASSFAGNARFSTWLFAITKNHCISQAHKKSKMIHKAMEDMDHMPEIRADEDDLEERIRFESLEIKLDEYLNLLSDQERMILELKYRKNYSVRDLQEELALSASAVKMRLLRARQRMNQILSLGEAA